MGTDCRGTKTSLHIEVVQMNTKNVLEKMRKKCLPQGKCKVRGVHNTSI